MSINIRDLPFPGPRGRPTPRLNAHPSAGRPPDLMDILYESALYKGPNPEGLDPESVRALSAAAENPGPDTIPWEVLGPFAVEMVSRHGITGTMPALQRTLVDMIAEGLIKRLDYEAKAQPTLARAILQPAEDAVPTFQELMGAQGPAPMFSDFFQGAGPNDNPELLRGMTTDLAERFGALPQEDLAPNQASGIHDALWYLRALPAISDVLNSGLPSNDLKRGHAVDILTDALKMLKQVGGLDLTETIGRSNIGSGNRYLGNEPESRNSLAPDFDALELGRRLAGPGQEPDSVNLLLKLMGIDSAPLPRGNV